MSREVAEMVLALDFTESDHRRITALSGKAQEGSLTERQREELEGYINISQVMALLQSKARISLKAQKPDSAG